MATYNITEKQVLGPIPVTHGSLVGITPSSGSVLVEYSKENVSSILNGTAIWQEWPYGTVTSTCNDIARRDFYIRVTAVTGASVVEIFENSNVPDILDHDWISIGMSMTTKQIDSTTGLAVDQKSTDRAAHVFEQGQIGGGEGEESALTAQTRVTENSNVSAYTDGTITIQTVTSAPARLTCIIIPNALAGTLTMTDNDTVKFVLPIGYPAGIHRFPGIRFTTNLKITLSSASDDAYVCWWPIGTGGI